MAQKYIADGFENDADLLLNEFALEKCSDFKVFASIWKKKNFSFIYMGRESSKEMGEFTNEIFSLSSKYLESDSAWHQIGGVFLLYALYRNQILNPPVRIRMELGKLEIMKRLLDKAIADKLYSLHYVLDYLFNNAIEVVACATLLGPGVRTFDKTKSEFEKKLQMSDFQYNLEELMENKALENLHESFSKYEKLKMIPGRSTENRRRNLISILGKLADERKNISVGGSVNAKAHCLSTSKNVSRNYPFIDSALNQTSDLDDISGNENDIMPESIFDDNENSELATMVNKGKQLFECHEIVQKLDGKKHKNIGRHIKKTRRIRKYYEGSPTKSIVLLGPSTDRTDSEDELLAD